MHPRLVLTTFLACILATGCTEPEVADSDLERTQDMKAPQDAHDMQSVDDRNPSDMSMTPSAEPSWPIVREADAQAAARGQGFLESGELGRGLLPEDALRHLYITWSDNPFDWQRWFTDAPGYWSAFRARYGFQDDPSRDLGVGLHRVGGGEVTFGCGMCHAGTVAGRLVWGAGNHELRLALLQDDLEALPAAIERARQLPLPPAAAALLANIPDPDPAALALPRWTTYGPGLSDAMGFALAIDGAPDDIASGWGAQAPPAWWAAKARDTWYLDGSGTGSAHRSMMAMHLAFGLTPADTLGLDDAFADIRDAILATEAPRWEDFGFELPDAALVARGRVLYDQECSSCHGGTSSYDEPIVDVGTSPVRSGAMDGQAAEYLNERLGERVFAPALVLEQISSPRVSRA